MIHKYGMLDSKINHLKAEIGKYKEVAPMIIQMLAEKMNYEDLSQELARQRSKITALLEEEKKQWETTKEKVAEVEDRQIVELGRELIKFDRTLKNLQKIKPTK